MSGAFDDAFDSDAFDATPFAKARIDHVIKALTRLPEQFKNSPVMIALIKALLSPAQEIEDVFLALLALKSIDAAEDAVLDLIGKIVGQERGGQDNPTYRIFIHVRITINQSQGLPGDYKRIVSLIYPEAKIEVRARGATAEVIVHGVVIDATNALILLSFMSDAHGAGVRVVLGTFPQTEATTFGYRSASQLLSGISIGAASFQLLTQIDLLTFPTSGFVNIDGEVIAYTIDVPSWTIMQVRAPGVTANHSAGAIVFLCDQSGTELNTGRGYGDGLYASGLETKDQ